MVEEQVRVATGPSGDAAPVDEVAGTGIGATVEVVAPPAEAGRGDQHGSEAEAQSLPHSPTLAYVAEQRIASHARMQRHSFSRHVVGWGLALAQLSLVV